MALADADHRVRLKLAPDRQNGAHDNAAYDVITCVDRPESARRRLPDISHGQCGGTKPKANTRTNFQAA
jgi:hypothetical protein